MLTERGNPSGESSDGAANAVDTGGKTNGVRKWLTPDSVSGFLGGLSWDRRGRGYVLGVILLAVLASICPFGTSYLSCPLGQCICVDI